VRLRGATRRLGSLVPSPRPVIVTPPVYVPRNAAASSVRELTPAWGRSGAVCVLTVRFDRKHRCPNSPYWSGHRGTSGNASLVRGDPIPASGPAGGLASPAAQFLTCPLAPRDHARGASNVSRAARSGAFCRHHPRRCRRSHSPNASWTRRDSIATGQVAPSGGLHSSSALSPGARRLALPSVRVQGGCGVDGGEFSVRPRAAAVLRCGAAESASASSGQDIAAQRQLVWSGRADQTSAAGSANASP